MRKHMEKDEPNNEWTDREIFFWMSKNGVLDEAHDIGSENERVQEIPFEPQCVG
jgi:hypothetical protein